MNTQPIEETRESLGELIRTVSRISNNTLFELNQTDRDRLEKAKRILSKHSGTDNSPILVQSVAPIDKTLDAAQHLKQLYPNPSHTLLSVKVLVEKCMESYGDLRVEQANEEWEVDHKYSLEVADIIITSKTIAEAQERYRTYLLNSFKNLNNGK